MDEKNLRILLEPALLTFHSNQITEFEAFYLSTSALKIESKKRQIDALSHSSDQGISFRVIRDRKPGFSFTTSLDSASILRAAQNAIDITSVMPEDPFCRFNALQKSYSQLLHVDQQGVDSPLQLKKDLAFSLEDACLDHDPRMKGVRLAAYSENHIQAHLIDSGLNHTHYSKVLFSLSVSCKAEENGDSQMGGEFGFSDLLNQLDPLKIGKGAAILALENLNSKSAPTMVCPAVFRNSVVADLLEFMSSGFSIEEVQKGRSLLAGKLGKAVFSSLIQITDDRTLPHGYATAPFDAEGSPAQKTILVQNGVLNQYLYDQYYAQKLGFKTTANSARSIKSPPSIGTSNLFIQNGDTSPKNLIKNFKKGVFITDLMGIHTANPVTGDFSLGATGILIENGCLTTPIRGFAVAGNILELFNKINALGNDMRFFGSTGAPSMSVSEISVGGN